MKRFSVLFLLLIMIISVISCSAEEPDLPDFPQEIVSEDIVSAEEDMVIVCDQSVGRVVVYDLKDYKENTSLDEYEVWSFNPNNKNCGAVSGVKYRENTVFGAILYTGFYILSSKLYIFLNKLYTLQVKRYTPIKLSSDHIAV